MQFLTQEHVDSAKSYAFGAGAIALPAIIADITGWLQFMTAIIGFVVIVHRAYHDFKTAREKRDGRPASKDNSTPPG